MTITIGSFSCKSFTAQPLGYEGEARSGLTARTFQVSGLVTASQWNALRTEYDTWRNLRIADEDTAKSRVVGTTINLTVSSVNGFSVTNLPCWFVDPPRGEQVGAYIEATAVLVDAAQALQVVLRQEEKQKQASESNVPDLGTITFGSVVIKLLQPLESRINNPAVTLTSTGTSLVTGALKAHKLRQVDGYIQSGTYDDLLTWFDTTIAAVPAADSWFPISPPQANAEVVVTNGVKATRYNVQLSVVQII